MADKSITYQDDHVAFFNLNPDPNVVLIAYIKVASTIQDETDFLVFVQVPKDPEYVGRQPLYPCA